MPTFAERVLAIIQPSIPASLYQEIVDDMKSSRRYDVGDIILELLRNNVMTTNLTKFAEGQSCVFADSENVADYSKSANAEIYFIGGDWESSLPVVIYITPNNEVDMFIPDNRTNGRIGLIACDVQNDWDIENHDLMADLQGTDAYAYIASQVNSVPDFVDFVKSFNSYDVTDASGSSMGEYLGEMVDMNFDSIMADTMTQFHSETQNGTVLQQPLPKTMRDSFTNANSKWWKPATDWLIQQYNNKTFQ